MFVAGDDAEAKHTVSGLIEDIGFVPIDTGRFGKAEDSSSPVLPSTQSG